MDGAEAMAVHQPVVHIPTPEEFVRSESARVYTLCHRLVGEADGAEECAQEALLRAVRALPSFRGAASVSTWVCRIAINVCRNWNRRARQSRRHEVRGTAASVEDEIVLRDRGDTPAEELMKTETARTVREAIDALPERQRTIVILREMEGLSYEDIARLLRVPMGTVRSRLFRARSALAVRLKEVRP
jgi:RNA polymerase sigma-70 factor (ECF subfamily)